MTTWKHSRPVLQLIKKTTALQSPVLWLGGVQGRLQYKVMKTDGVDDKITHDELELYREVVGSQRAQLINKYWPQHVKIDSEGNEIPGDVLVYK